ncbi:YwqG family protein [Flavobacterium tistrianum]|uniref:YwqG family protein n=1 Tax=Flavobacterium tistrianum TaxID=1685414 RepID=UPI000DAC6B70|nr:YwqG family protein [Flavobacterium tistrianum]KAF2340915.1 DUF1963 domain-containing protein [Flavobacterium tistrianum]
MNTLLPEFLKKFEKDLLDYKLNYIEINTYELQKNEIIGITDSKYLGNPYIPISAEYPKDKNGNLMPLIIQINFSEMPKLENYPDSGILQVYLDKSYISNSEFHIIYHEKIEEYHTDFSFLPNDFYDEVYIVDEGKISFFLKEEYASTGDFRFDYKFNGLNEDLLNEIEKEQFSKLFNHCSYKIGGYGSFYFEEDPRIDDDDSKDDILLLQLDNDVEIHQIFINKFDLINKQFDKTYSFYQS